MLTVPDPVQATWSVLGSLEVWFCVRPFLDPRPVAASAGKLGREQPNVDTGLRHSLEPLDRKVRDGR
jgi:hypothetical protein